MSEPERMLTSNSKPVNSNYEAIAEPVKHREEQNPEWQQWAATPMQSHLQAKASFSCPRAPSRYIV
jgi:hypothetical protein